MSQQIDRNLDGRLFLLDANLKSPVYPIPGKAGGGIITLAGFGGDGFTFEVGADKNSLYPLYDGAGAAISVVIAAEQACGIPEEAMKFAFIRAVATGVGAAQGQTAAMVFKS